MSEETPKPIGIKTDDGEINNLKQEMNRKLGSYEQKLADLAQTNQALLAKLSQITIPKASDDDDLDKMWYDDPKKAAARIKEQTKAEIMAEYQRDQEVRSRTQSTLAALVNDYPELNDSNSELTRRAVEIYNSMTDSEKTSPVAYKAAVREAASDLGVVPMKRRAQQEDSFTGSSSSSQSSERKRSKGKDDLDPKTIAFAQMVGLDMSDEKTVESIKNRAKRAKWDRYE
jgi:hypothetical protein